MSQLLGALVNSIIRGAFILSKKYQKNTKKTPPLREEESKKKETENRIQLQQAIVWDMDKNPNDAAPEKGTECGTGVTSEAMEKFTVLKPQLT